MAKFTSTQKYNLKGQKMAFKNAKQMAKIRNAGKAATTKAVGKSVVELASVITTPISAMKVTQSNNDRKIAEANRAYNNQNMQQALDKWMDQMDGNPSSEGASGSSGTSQNGSTTDYGSKI